LFWFSHAIFKSKDMKNNKSLTLGIVIPVFNEQDQIKSCLESIANQSVLPDEVIVVDNNSSDNTATIASEYPFVKVVQERQQGVLYARTAGFNAVKSDIIGRIDAETHLKSDWVEQVKRIFEDESISAVSGPVGFHDAPFRKLGLFADKNIRKATWNIGIKDDAVFLFGSNMAMRKKAWNKVKNKVCARKDVHEDIDLAIHLDQIGEIIAFDETLTAMTSSRRMQDSTQDFYRYLQIYKETYAVHGIQSPAVDMTVIVVLSAKFGVNLLQRAYDPKTQQFSIKKFIKGGSESRQSPVEL